jgi:hypothetical protein
MVDTRGLTGDFNNPFTRVALELREEPGDKYKSDENTWKHHEAAKEEQKKYRAYKDKYGTRHIDCSRKRVI